MLINTVFGYVVSGAINIPNNTTVRCNFVVNDDLQRFWAIEEIPTETLALTKEEKLCEDYFDETVTRDISGKFIRVVRFPLKCSASTLGNSYNIAIKRLLSQENKLKKSEILKDKYVSFMNEYIELEHMKQLSNDAIQNFRCFLPHFAVVRQESITTDVRVVFDASVKTDSGKSLNDIQYPGSAIQNDIFSIILRFRQHKYVVVADIAKMYRQIFIHPDERYLQNVVWRSNFNDNIELFELQTVTYGTTSAPYLAMKCIKKLANDNKDIYPVACKIIDHDMYVDDLITGFNEIDQAITICNQIAKVLKSAAFSLRKWASNSETILAGLEETYDAFSILDLSKTDKIKTLGLQWSAQSDSLSYKVIEYHKAEPLTKRQLLSSIAKIFDPLGLVSPCIIKAKILIQQLWSLKLDWDATVPLELQEKWEVFQIQLSALNKLTIPRSVMCQDPVDIEFHGFSDASLQAYSAVVYVRTTDCIGKTWVQLLCAKTKVAPVKALTIPRLELCGALILARLMKQVSDSFTCNFKIYYWCDSQIVLHWLNTDANKLQTFVSNRVAQIQKLCEISQWSYINSKDNPADVASRGMYPKELSTCRIWWEGPTFLYGDVIWPCHFKPHQTDLPEIRKTVNILTAIPTLSIFDRYSDLKKLRRVFGYCLRFIYNMLNKTKRLSGPLTVLELENSMLHLTKIAQQDTFRAEISSITNDNSLSKKHRLSALNPFIDSDGLLRVGGRLKNSSLSFNQKHPILLDGKHVFTKMIFQLEHVKLHHAGAQLLLFSVRQNYWTTSGMNVAKLSVRKCIRCFRAKPKPASSIMADLPKQRVQVSRPFSITGIDYAGPVSLRDRKGRSYKT
nr:unnamed protein product [Callosobruchus analis]